MRVFFELTGFLGTPYLGILSAPQAMTGVEISLDGRTERCPPLKMPMASGDIKGLEQAACIPCENMMVRLQLTGQGLYVVCQGIQELVSRHRKSWAWLISAQNQPWVFKGGGMLLNSGCYPLKL